MQKEELRGTWLTQLVEHVTLDLGVVSSSPTLDMEPTSKNKQKPQTGTPNINAKGRIKPALYHHLKSLQKG